MKASTLAIQSYRKIEPASRNEMHAVTARSNESNTAAIIPITDKSDQEANSLSSTASKGWVMPPIMHPYLKGRDNDPL